jgi:hypothetical protein
MFYPRESKKLNFQENTTNANSVGSLDIITLKCSQGLVSIRYTTIAKRGE